MGVKKTKFRPGTFHLKNFAGTYDKLNYTDLLATATTDMLPEDAFNQFREYFRYCEENPIEVTDTAAFRGDLNEDVIQKIRPFTLRGMCNFAGISMHRFRMWREGDGDLAVICRWAEDVIEDQKFSGAAVGVFNSAVIMKDISPDKNQSGDTSSAKIPEASDDVKKIARELRDKL